MLSASIFVSIQPSVISNQLSFGIMTILIGKLGIDFDTSLLKKFFKLSPKTSFS